MLITIVTPVFLIPRPSRVCNLHVEYPSNHCIPHFYPCMARYPRSESPMSPVVNHTCSIKRPSNFALVSVCPCSSGEGRRPLDPTLRFPSVKQVGVVTEVDVFFYYGGTSKFRGNPNFGATFSSHCFSLCGRLCITFFPSKLIAT